MYCLKRKQLVASFGRCCLIDKLSIGIQSSRIFNNYTKKMTVKSALILLAKGNEEMELVIPADVLRRAGINVTIGGLEGNIPHECSRKVKITPDASLDEAVAKGPYDIVILPGGLAGSKAFAESEAVKILLKEQESSGKTIGAICAAPTALMAHKICSGKNVTAYPCFESDMNNGGYKYSKDRVVIDGELITSQGPGTAFEFAIAIVKHLLGSEAAKEVAAPLLLS